MINTLKTKFIALMILCSLLFVMSLTGISTFFTHQTAMKEAESNLMNLTTNYSSDLNNMITEKESIANSIAAYVASTFDMERFKLESDYFEVYVSALALFIEDMANRFGDSWIFFDPDLTDQAYDIWYFDQYMTGKAERMPQLTIEAYQDKTDPSMRWFNDPIMLEKSLWTDPYLYNITDANSTTFITYSIPVFVEGVLIGVVGSDFDVTQLLDEMSDIVVYKSGYAYIVDQTFRYMVHPKYGYEDDISETDPKLYEDIRTGDGNNTSVINYSEKNVFVSHVRTLNNWLLFMEVPTDEIYAVIYRQIMVMLLISLLIFVLIMMLGIGLSIRITKPLELLTRSVNQIGKGQYDLKLTGSMFERADEVGLLKRAIEEMVELIKESLDKLNKRNVELDILVDQRTSELSSTNDELSISLELLQKLQLDIIEKEKKTALARIMMEINHRVRTPLSASMNYIDFVKRKLSKMENKVDDDILTAIQQSDEQLRIISTIINSLSVIMINVAEDYISDIDVEKRFSDTVKLTSGMFSVSDKFSIDTTSKNALKLKTYPKVLATIFDQLVRFSLLFPVDAVHRHVSVSFEIKDKYMKIVYSDIEAFRVVDKLDIFEPFKYMSFQKGLIGMEMYIVQELCNNTLNGQILFNNDNMASPYIEIMIPDLKSNL